MRVRPDHHPAPGRRDPGRSATQSGPPAQLRFPPNSREQPPSGQRAPLPPAEARQRLPPDFALSMLTPPIAAPWPPTGTWSHGHTSSRSAIPP